MSVFQNQVTGGVRVTTCFSLMANPTLHQRDGLRRLFLGAWDFGGHPFSYRLYGAAVVGEERAGGKSSVYRFQPGFTNYVAKVAPRQH